ncbi:SH3 domain-containing protein [Accumulibacter sp.]|uniref:SH3 domain-containing protein n=1 Tax=Accumulibacter sp. TaxID=2053492 RepID=UPI0028C412FE|nr:SH3 domain-containing protein [Accumulibacter sp.]
MNGTRQLIACFAAGLMFACGQALGGEDGTARKASEVRKTPYRDARAVGVLATGDKVDILEKRGGWYRVKSASLNGWVRMLSIRRGQARKGGGGTHELVALVTGRAGTGRVVSTTGIRGLDEEELKLARFDAAALRVLDAYAASPAEAQRFARQGKLTARAVD